jgi:6-phosphogluconolactonase (cycloisomerase 2 family)
MKRTAALLAGALAALVLGAGSATAATDCCGNFRTPGQLAISHDGRFVYVSDRQTTLAIQRNVETGALTALDAYDGGGSRTELSPDGRFLYVGSENYIFIFERDRASGRLTPRREVKFGYGRSLADFEIAPDGRQMYVTNPSGLEVYDRSNATGAVTHRKTLVDGVDGVVLPHPTGLALSPDGRFVYAGAYGDGPDGTAVGEFARAADGGLTYAGRQSCGCAPIDLEMTPDGGYLYAGAGRPNIFARDKQSGALAEGVAGAPQFSTVDGTAVDGGLAISPDGRGVYGVNSYDDTIYQAAVPAQWFDEKSYRDGDDGMKGLHAPAAVAVSPDSRFVIVAGGGSWAGEVPSTIATFRRDPATNDLTFASLAVGSSQDGRPTGSPPPSISINDGANYTNDPHVTVTLDLPNWGPQVEVANDGGFGDSSLFTWAYALRVPWTLASTGPDRLPKSVYARSVPANGPEVVYKDEIVLDETAPTVVSARATVHVLRVKATDRLSGVAKVQIARDRKHPGSWLKFQKGKAYTVGDGRPWVRVRDRARNASSWRRTVR